MKIGILVEVEEGLDWDGWRRVVAAAERLGFESVWLSDHLRSPWFSGQRGLETWTALAVAATQTSQLVLGSLVSPVTFREPAIVARMANSLWSLSRGRFVVGLGMGWNTDEHQATGIPFPNLAIRRQRLVDTIERIRCEGEVPVLIGGRGQSVLPLVARFANEWNITGGSAADFTRAREQLEALCMESGRNLVEIRSSVAAGFVIGRDQDDLHVRAKRLQKCVPPLTSVDAARDMGWVVGTPEQVRLHVQELAHVGVDRVIFGHYQLDDDESLELLAETLL